MRFTTTTDLAKKPLRLLTELGKTIKPKRSRRMVAMNDPELEAREEINFAGAMMELGELTQEYYDINHKSVQLPTWLVHQTLVDFGVDKNIGTAKFISTCERMGWNVKFSKFCNYIILTYKEI